jgi:3-phenylpropionate/trans-cinnamate dioxygenase ferredoxin subunit
MYNYKIKDTDQMEFIPVARVEELGDGQRLLFEIDGEPIALFNISGEYFAIADVCSHDDGPVAEGDLDDHQIACPRHGAMFDIRTGEALSLPAVVDIPAYPVRIEGDELQIGLPIG